MALSPFYQNLVNSGRLKLQKPAATPAAATAPTGSPRPNYALQAAQAFRPRPVDQGDGSTFGSPIAQTPESRRAAMNAVTRDRSEIGTGPTSESTIGGMMDRTKSFGTGLMDSFTRGIRPDQLPSTIGRTLLGAAAGGGIPGLIVSQLAGGVEDIFRNASFRNTFEDAGIDTEGGPMEGGFLNTINELFGFGGIDSNVSMQEQPWSLGLRSEEYPDEPTKFTGRPGSLSFQGRKGIGDNVPSSIDYDMTDMRKMYEDINFAVNNPDWAGSPTFEDLDRGFEQQRLEDYQRLTASETEFTMPSIDPGVSWGGAVGAAAEMGDDTDTDSSWGGIGSYDQDWT